MSCFSNFNFHKYRNEFDLTTLFRQNYLLFTCEIAFSTQVQMPVNFTCGPTHPHTDCIERVSLYSPPWYWLPLHTLSWPRLALRKRKECRSPPPHPTPPKKITLSTTQINRCNPDQPNQLLLFWVVLVGHLWNPVAYTSLIHTHNSPCLGNWYNSVT